MITVHHDIVSLTSTNNFVWTVKMFKKGANALIGTVPSNSFVLLICNFFLFDTQTVWLWRVQCDYSANTLYIIFVKVVEKWRVSCCKNELIMSRWNYNCLDTFTSVDLLKQYHLLFDFLRFHCIINKTLAFRKSSQQICIGADATTLTQ